MALESVTYISDFNSANPQSTDWRGDGYKHIQRLKSGIVNTFPNVTGAVASTHTELNVLDGLTASVSELNVMDGITASLAELNYCDGVTSAIQTQLNAKLAAPTISVKTSNFTASVGYLYIIRTTSTRTVTLPASPSAGNRVYFVSEGSTHLVNENGSKVMGASSASNLTNGTFSAFIYVDATTGWARIDG